MIEGCTIEAGRKPDWQAETIAWQTILPAQKLQADHEHYFEKELENTKQTFTHVRLTIFPDGGISRMRLWGNIVSHKEH